MGEGTRVQHARSAEAQTHASTIGKRARATSADGEASTSTIGKVSSARRAKQTRTTRCRRISRALKRCDCLFCFAPVQKLYAYCTTDAAATLQMLHDGMIIILRHVLQTHNLCF